MVMKHLTTCVQFEHSIGVLSAVHFMKLENGNLQISITTPSPSGAAVIECEPDTVENLVRVLVGGFMTAALLPMVETVIPDTPAPGPV